MATTTHPQGAPGPRLHLSTDPLPSHRRQSAAEHTGLATIALLLLPGGLLAFLGFDAGGYFPTAPAIAAVLLTQILLLRLLQAKRPFEGLAPATLAALAALGGYGAWTLASELWSHAPGRALIEFDRTWLYLAALLLYGTLRADAARLRWLLRGLLAGITAVCLAGLVSRVAPDVWHTAPDVANERLSYPVTYWNALGLLAALGIVLAVHTASTLGKRTASSAGMDLASSLGERRSVQALAAGVTPLLGATLFFTFSRGAMAAGAAGLAVYLLVGRPKALLSGLIATIPPGAALALAAYHANLLDTVNPTTPAAVSQGHRVALIAALCCLAAGGLRLALARTLDLRLASLGERALLGKSAKRMAWGGGAVACVGLVLALGLPSRLSSDWHRFMSGAQPHGTHSDLRERLTDPSNNGRTELWKVALHGFSSSPAHGHGAGTFQTVWDRRRPRFVYTVNAHSLYLQALVELGIPGLALLLLFVAAVLVGLALRARGPDRPLYGVLLAGAVVWSLHAGTDWDWEMPVVTLWLFAAAGLALSPLRPAGGANAGHRADLASVAHREDLGAAEAGTEGSALRAPGSAGWVPGHDRRLLLGLACLATLALPVLVIGSQRRLAEAEHGLYSSHDCRAASSAALSSIGWLSVRAQPYEVLGWCDLRRGLPHLGIEAMREAVRRDPGDWEGYYGLAIAQASAGIDPRSNVRRALRMNPLEPLTRQAARELSNTTATEWVAGAAKLRAAALASSDLSIVPS